MKTELFQSGGQCWVFQICWQYMCSYMWFTGERNNKTKQLASQMSIHPKVVEGRKGKWEWRMTQGERGFRSVLAQGWQMLEKGWEKLVVLSDTQVFKVHAGFRKILPYMHLTQKSGLPRFLREKGTWAEPSRGMLHLPWVWGWRVQWWTRKRAPMRSFWSHPSPPDGR